MIVSKVEKVIISIDRNDFFLNIIFCGESECLLFKESYFTKYSKEFKNLDLYDKNPIFLIDVFDIEEIREDEDLDSYYILLDDKSIFRIFFSQVNGEIQQIIEHHRFNENANSYYHKLYDWLKKSEVIYPNDGNNSE